MVEMLAKSRKGRGDTYASRFYRSPSGHSPGNQEEAKSVALEKAFKQEAFASSQESCFAVGQ